ncbi:MAG: glycosyltransferase family 4 protein [Zoogloeaceae bacterium]|nr:glycosyltransferase family 4 protein [Zoogloeaceae bacterium]
MRLAFVLHKYFPFGGLQRDFLRIARECARRGHAIRVYTLRWQGEIPPGFDVRMPGLRRFCADPGCLLNHWRYERFAAETRADLARDPAERVIGFNKMPGLDFYYAADPCFAEKARGRGFFYRLSGRCRHFVAQERAVFAPEAQTQILLIASAQQAFFTRHYGTPAERFHLLPPGIDRDRRAPPNAAAIRAGLRAEFGLRETEFLLLAIGSGFRTKGLDRSLAALAALPLKTRERARLIVIGQDNPRPFLRLARRLGQGERVTILPGRGDIPRFLLGADLLMHPAYHENTGTVLLEALAAGLPVLVTDVCGYAGHVSRAEAGVVLPSPFRQEAMNQTLAAMLAEAPARRRWAENGLRYADVADLYSMPQHAADIILA